MSIKALDRIFYPDYADNWDDSLFRQRILGYLKPEHTVLDLGAGSGLVQQMNFRGVCRSVYGLDPDASVLANSNCDMSQIGTGERIPWADATFDVVFANNVLEHLGEPEKVFAEICRVLKPGGTFLAKTPNRFHYVTLTAQLTPTSFHQFINSLRGRSKEDTFPTRYRANSAARLRKLARMSGMDVIKIDNIEGRPEYMRISQVLYVAGLVWERVVNASTALGGLRILLIAVFQKKQP